MISFILSLVVAFFVGIIWAVLCYLFGFESFRENFWIAAIIYFVADWFLTGVVALGKRESQVPW